VHHLNNSRSQRVLWLLEEMGLDYEIVHHQRDAKTMLAPDSLLKVHALGKSPVITDGDITVAESGAIVEYLVDRYAAETLAPARGTPARLHYSYWLHFSEGSAMPPLVFGLVFARIAKAPMPFFVKPIAKGIAAKVLDAYVDPQLRRNLAFIESGLAQTGWFAGDGFSAADIQMSFPVEAYGARGALAAAPATQQWLERVRARPAYVRALERGGPYSLSM
ncbi:MAG: glutathione S-transferase, partial [Dokdonella sp.]